MRYAALKENDATNGIGVCVSLWVQYCPLRCKGCHNPQTWSENGGFEIQENELIERVLNALNKNGVQRDLSILGGEPLSETNRYFVERLICAVKQQNPEIKIYLWSGYEFDRLLEQAKFDSNIKYILDNLTFAATGPFMEEQRDVTLSFVGSRNQEVWWNLGDGIWKTQTLTK